MYTYNHILDAPIRFCQTFVEAVYQYFFKNNLLNTREKH